MTDFDTGSLAYSAVRWLWFLSITGVSGAVAFRFAVIGRLASASHGFHADAARRAARAGLACALFTAAAALLRLAAQAQAIFGEIGADVGILISATAWGRGWLLHALAAPVAVAGFMVASRGRMAGWLLAAAAAAALACTPALAGHAAASEGLGAVPIASDAIHVAAVGGWIGGLLILLTAGIPAALADHRRDTYALVAAVVNAFSPLALACATAAGITGVFAAWLHIGSVPALLHSDYGRILLLKLAVLLPVLALGAYNFLALKRRLDQPDATARLRRTAFSELIAGACVLAVTAILVATPPPTTETGAVAATSPEAVIR